MENLIKEAVQKFGNTREHLHTVMWYIVAKSDVLTEGSFESIAREFNISAAEVQGTAALSSFVVDLQSTAAISSCAA